MKFSIILLLATMLLAGCALPIAQTNSASGSTGQRNTAISQSTATETTAAPMTRAQAEAIALKHAGFTADQISQLRTEYEIDDGVPRFEVRFRQDRWEYSYEINAETGTILSYDRDD